MCRLCAALTPHLQLPEEESSRVDTSATSVLSDCTATSSHCPQVSVGFP